MRSISLSGVTCALVLLASPLVSTPARAADDLRLSVQDRTEVVEGLIGLLEDLYVIPETAATIRDHLREQLAAGGYDELDTGPAFAGALTDDMQALSRDKHLRVRYGEEEGGPGPGRVVVGEGPGDGPRRIVREPGGGSDGGVFQGVEAFPRAEMLPGNVGLVEVRLFPPREMAEEQAVEAMKAVAGADALIFDLRRCMGGAPDMVHLIQSYLYPPEPFHLLTYHYARTEPDEAFTLKEIPGERMADADVYILASHLTGSAGEEFTYVLKHHGRATVVGELTAGAGHGGGVHPITAGFSAFIPDFRPVHPVTGEGWEAVGVRPDVEVAADRALAVAHRDALRKRLPRLEDSAEADRVRAEIARLDEEIARVEERSRIDPAALAEYPGNYEIRTITAEDGDLYLQRTGGPKLRLVPTGEKDSFSLELLKKARVNFARDDDGRIVELHVLDLEGRWQVTKRRE